MGREIKRVPVDFDWPLSKVWEGFLTPERLQELPCPAKCSNGNTAAGEWLTKMVHLLLMLPDEVPGRKSPDTDSARRGTLHPWLQSMEWRPSVPPSEDIAELTGGLAGRPPRGAFGHDAIDNWQACKAIVSAAGLNPDSWGLCPVCQGHARVEAYEGQRAEAEAWESTGPPAGDGWQLWETVSEGSPVSPVFADAEGLAQWLTSPAAKYSRLSSLDVARKFVADGWAPTFVSTPETGFVSGAEWIGQTAKGEPS